MSFWIFMLITAVLCPVIMIVAGALFLKKFPKKINAFVGYRTQMSVKSSETWEFAHKHCGRLWLILGAVMLPISLLPMLFVMEKSIETQGTVGAVVSALNVIVLIVSVFPTERALRKNFDSNGNRK